MSHWLEKKKKGVLENLREDKIKLDAKRAIQGFVSNNTFGGYGLKHKPSVYGLAFKYILHLRGISYREAARYVVMSAQSLNYAFNRMRKECFDYALVEKLCTRLKLSTDYFYALVDEIERQLSEQEESKETD